MGEKKHPFDLTPAGDRWRKRYRHKWWSRRLPAGRDHASDYQDALKAFRKWKVETDAKLDGTLTPHQEIWNQFVGMLAQSLAHYQQTGEPWEWRQTKALQERFQQYAAENVTAPIIGRSSHGSKPAPPPPPDEPWKEEIPPANGFAPPKTLADAIARYLADAQARVEADKLTTYTFRNLRSSLNDVQRMLDCSVAIAKVGAGEVTGFHDVLMATKLQDSTRHKKQSDFWQLLRYAVRNQWLAQLPPNIGDAWLSFAGGVSDVAPLSDNDLKTLLGLLDGPKRLWMFVALNTAATQTDLASMRHVDLDLEHGRLIRKRTKTKRRETVPTVNYLLWPETVALLREHCSDHPELVLLNERGNPLTSGRIGPNQHTTITDAVGEAWREWLEGLSVEWESGKPSFKRFRKTAASKLEQHDTFFRYKELFLGHAPATIADRHYVAVNQEGFDSAVEWLGCWVRSLMPT